MELVDRLARHMGRDPGRAPRRGEGGSRRLSPVAFGPARLCGWPRPSGTPVPTLGLVVIRSGVVREHWRK